MPKKIYFVDQSELITSHLKKVLGEQFIMRSCQYADKALMEIIDWSPDALITGVEIGNITGFDLCMILKMIPEHAGMPIILLSSYEIIDASRRAAEVGADCYIKKGPLAAQEIVHALDDLIFQQNLPKQIYSKQVEKVLLVDDSPLIRQMLSNMLKSAGVKEIVQAGNGEEGLCCLESETFDIVLTDYHMPVMNGPELVQKIRQKKQLHDLPIIIATGEEKEQQIEQVLNDGANGIIIKPISIKSIKKILNAYQNNTILSFGYNKEA